MLERAKAVELPRYGVADRRATILPMEDFGFGRLVGEEARRLLEPALDVVLEHGRDRLGRNIGRDQHRQGADEEKRQHEPPSQREMAKRRHQPLDPALAWPQRTSVRGARRQTCVSLSILVPM